MIIGLGVGLPFARSAGYNIGGLFANGEQGAWYDPSDFGTLYQDSAGTTQVTAVGQPVGKMLDKSGRGNHATQPTAVNRPVISARVNLLTKTEDFSDAGWLKNLLTVSANATMAPDGQLTADLVYPTTSGGARYVNKDTTGQTPGAAFRTKVRIKAAGMGFAYIYNVQGNSLLYVDLSTGATSNVGANISNLLSPRSADGWVDVSFTSTLTSGTTASFYAGPCDASGSTQAVANGTAGIYLWGASLIPVSLDSLPYQRVNTASDYDTVGFPLFGGYNGTNSSIVSASGGGGSTGFFLCQAIKVAGNDLAARTLWSDTGTDTGYRVRINAANQLELAASNGAPIATPVQAAASTATTGGTGLAASTAYYYKVTALNALGETIASNEQTVTTGLGTTNSNTVNWAAVTGATGYKVYRGTAAGAENVFYGVGDVITYVDTGAASTAGSPPVLGETAYVKVASVATIAVGTLALITAWDDGTNLNVQIGSGAIAQIARPVVVAGTAAITIGSDNGAATGYFSGNLYAEVYRQIVPSAAQIASTQTYCRSKAGL